MKITKSKPLFIVGSGRNGTRSIFRMLRGNLLIEAHHEYMCENIQKISCLYSMGLISRDKCKEKVFNHYYPAINYSKKEIWLDSSNKASWIIDILSEIFPSSRFIHLIRDPRRVVPSFYYKLREEMYDSESVNSLANWINNGMNANQVPPPEKKYWWKLNLNKDNNIEKKEIDLPRFKKVCRHWIEINEAIDNSLSNLPKERYCVFKLEDLVESKKSINLFLKFLGLPESPYFFDFLQKPRNVFLPLEFNCTKEQELILNNICSIKAREYGYDLNEKLLPINY
tara:strand:+ start:643 stop:1491 length:849 start_codon:yes stop_codon:yes gene_type:complete